VDGRDSTRRIARWVGTNQVWRLEHSELEPDFGVSREHGQIS